MGDILDKDVTITFTRRQLVETILAIHRCIAQNMQPAVAIELHEVLNKIKLATETKEDK